jgi:type IV pilus assembly protein PilN
MAKINLLPWREERRQELKKQFIAVLVGVAVLGAGTVYLMNMQVEAEIHYQQSRNQFVTEETRKLDAQIAEIAELKKKRERLIERMNVIQDLQGNRPLAVHVFDEIARSVPDGAFYLSVEQKGEALTATGIAESNTRISNLMRNLETSPSFMSPNLSKVAAHAADKNEEKGGSEFNLSFKIEKPKASDGEG